MVSMGWSSWHDMSQTLIARLAMAVAALPMPLLSLASREWLLQLVEPGYVKSLMTSPMEMLGVLVMSWPTMLVFFRLIVKTNSPHSWEKQLTSH